MVLWGPVFIGIGVIWYFYLKNEPSFWVGPFGVVFSFLAYFHVGGRGKAGWALVLLAICFVALGFSAAQVRTASVAAPVLAKAIGPTSVEGRVVSIEPRSRGERVTLVKPRIRSIGPHATPQKVRIVISGDSPPLEPGDWITVRARLSPPPPPAAPGAFGFQRRFFFDAIGAVGFSYGGARVTSKASADSSTGPLQSTRMLISALRQHVGQRVQEAFTPSDEQAVGAVTRALMTGERGAIPDSVMQDFRDSGIAHLLAISGLHIGLVAGIVFLGARSALALVGPLVLRYSIKKGAAVAAIMAAFAYAMMAGATVPTLRAFLMISVVLCAVIFERRGLSLRLIAFAATVILLLKPESLLGASFQLSFAAVTALVAVYEVITERKRPNGRRNWSTKLLLYIGGVLLTTLIAGLATAPYAAFHFNRFADYGLAANLLAVPMTGLWVMPWAVVAFALMPLGLEHLALAPMGWGVDLIIRISAEVASWPGAVTLLPAMSDLGLAAITLGGLWLCLWRRKWRLAGLGGVAAGLASLLWVESPDILVDEKGRLMGLMNPQGQLMVSSLQTARFTRDIWLRRAGQETPSSWRKGEQVPACDTLGCVYTVRGKKIALVRDEGAVDEDCRIADILIASVPVRQRCEGPSLVIDRFDLWRNGTYAIWLHEGGGYRLKTVNGERGHRPWVLRPRGEKKDGV